MLKDLYMNRELSWINFNERVLNQAQKSSNPPLERLRFLSIVSSNLDEFYMIRYGSLFDQYIANPQSTDNKSKMNVKEQLEAILKSTLYFNYKKEAVFCGVLSSLEQYGIRQLQMQSLNSEQLLFIREHFTNEIAPLLSPQVIDNKHLFPHILNKVVYTALYLKRKDKSFLGLIPVSGFINKIVQIPLSNTIDFVLTEDVILYFADELFKNHDVVSKVNIRITRNADIDAVEAYYDEDIEDYRTQMKNLIKKRTKLAPVRLQVSSRMIEDLDDLLTSKLEILQNQIFIENMPLDFSYVASFEHILNKNLRAIISYEALSPRIPNWFNENKTNMLSTVLNRDVYLHYPFDSTKPYIKLLKDAANDESVTSIKITLYRLSSDSRVIENLIEAANNGKEVTAVLELRARFDEQNNINWSERLEDAGCTVVYGVSDYKIHSKITLITKKDRGKLKYITHFGTGNYNEKTAKFYTDMNILTSNEKIGLDGIKFFNNITTSNLKDTYSALLVSPFGIKNAFLAMIKKEIEIHKKHGNGYIFMKFNSLTDKDMIDELIKASIEGVKIDLVIRGICCLLPQVVGKTDNITIRSIVGRFLEHSRIYYFNANGDKNIYIASADLMTRNMERRIEIAVPVYDYEIKNKIIEYIDIVLRDNSNAMLLSSDGEYREIKDNNEKMDCQEYMFKKAYAEATKAQMVNNETKAKRRGLFDFWFKR